MRSMSSPKKAAAKPSRQQRPAAGQPLPPTQPKLEVIEAKRANGSSADAKRLAAQMEQALAKGRRDLISPEALQALMAAACKTYAAHVEAGEELLPLPPRGGATATEVMVTASGLLKAANLAVFELGMWQSWTGR
jgi:hypothetical protein